MPQFKREKGEEAMVVRGRNERRTPVSKGQVQAGMYLDVREGASTVGDLLDRVHVLGLSFSGEAIVRIQVRSEMLQPGRIRWFGSARRSRGWYLLQEGLGGEWCTVERAPKYQLFVHRIA